VVQEGPLRSDQGVASRDLLLERHLGGLHGVVGGEQRLDLGQELRRRGGDVLHPEPRDQMAVSCEALGKASRLRERTHHLLSLRRVCRHGGASGPDRGRSLVRARTVHIPVFKRLVHARTTRMTVL
jgi:hypothetical protein